MDMTRPRVHAHRLVAETAIEMANELYDTLMRNNDWYEVWKRRHPGLGAKGLERAFVKLMAGDLVPTARATLAEMLRRPIDPEAKDKIMEALILDSTLRGPDHREVRKRHNGGN